MSEKELEEAKKKAKELQARNVSLTRPKLAFVGKAYQNAGFLGQKPPFEH